MNCQEFEERITPAVDGRLEGDEAGAFRDHAAACPPCRRAYETERAVHDFVRKRSHALRTPGGVAAAIMDRLADPRFADAAAVRSTSRFRVTRLGFAVAAVLGGAALVTSALVSDLDPLPGIQPDVFAQSIATYAGMIGGTVKPQIMSTRPEVLQAFFTGRTTFPVHMAAVRDLTPVGALINETSGVPLAHIVYDGHGSLVYVYQTCWHTVQDGKKLNLPEHIMAALRGRGSYVEEGADGRTMVLWTDGPTLCGAVADMRRQDLLSHLDVVTPAAP